MKLVPSCIFALCLSVVAFQSRVLAQAEPDVSAKPIDEAPLEEVNCESVATAVYQSLSKDPKLVLPLIEDAISTHNSCAPLIVATAIEATGAASDPDLLKQIVMLGVQLSAKTGTDIAQEAVLVAPDSADVIRSAFTEAFDSMENAADKPPVKEGPKSKWEERTNEAESMVAKSDGEPKIEVEKPKVDLKTAVEAPRAPRDFPKEAVLPEPKPLIVETPMESLSSKTGEPTVAFVEEPTADLPSTPAVWAGEKGDESPMVIGAQAMEDRPSTTAGALPKSNSPSSSTVKEERQSSPPAQITWQSEVTLEEVPRKAPIKTPRKVVGEGRDYFAKDAETQVGELYFVPAVSTSSPTSSAVRRVSRRPLKDPTVRVITREENRRRPSFSDSPVVRRIQMPPTAP